MLRARSCNAATTSRTGNVVCGCVYPPPHPPACSMSDLGDLQSLLGEDGAGARAEVQYDVHHLLFEAGGAVVSPRSLAYVTCLSAATAAARTAAVKARAPPALSDMVDAAFGATGARPDASAPTSLTPSCTPLTGLSVQPLDVDAGVQSLRCERQLWRLVHTVMEYLCPALLSSIAVAAAAMQHNNAAARAAAAPDDDARTALPLLPEAAFAGALPLDAVSNVRLLHKALDAYDTERVLLRTLVSWLSTSAADDAEVTDAHGKSGSVAAAKQALMHPDALNGAALDDGSALFSAGMDVDAADVRAAMDHPLLLPQVGMWRATTFAAAAALARAEEDESDAGDAFRGALHPDAVLASAPRGGEGTELPPLSLADADWQPEADMLRSMWNLLRCGEREAAAMLAVRFGQPWRAAVLQGADHWYDEQVRRHLGDLRNVGDMRALEGRLRYRRYRDGNVD
ncbi:MAG: hypothetical protein EOO41_02270, partial [Methanobacteriota archaeon]